MRPCLIDVGDVFLQGPDELGHADHLLVIQTLLPQTSHKAFTNRIRTRCMVGRVDHLNACCFGQPLKLRTGFFVIVTDQVFRLLVKRRRVAHLLGNPFVRRVFRNKGLPGKQKGRRKQSYCPATQWVLWYTVGRASSYMTEPPAFSALLLPELDYILPRIRLEHKCGSPRNAAAALGTPARPVQVSGASGYCLSAILHWNAQLAW
jgi:hypothetical protein